MARLRGNNWQGSLKTTDKYYRYQFPTEALAVEWEKQAREARSMGLPIPEPTVIKPKDLTLSEFYKEQRDVIWPDALPRNVEANQRACERFLSPTTPIHHITERKLSETVGRMIRAGNKAGTINTRLSHLRVLLRHAKRLGLVEVTPEFPWQRKGDNSRHRFLTVEEETQMLDLMTHWGLQELRELTEALIDTGCRPSELITGETKGAPIKWNEVSRLAGGTAPDVNNPETGQAKAVITINRTKTGKYRVLPLTDRACAAFLSSKDRGDKRPFGNLRSDDASKLFRKVADHLGLEDVVLYTCRHTCASRLVQRGADLRRVKDWMGHDTITTTLKYAKLTPGDIFKLEQLL